METINLPTEIFNRDYSTHAKASRQLDVAIVRETGTTFKPLPPQSYFYDIYRKALAVPVPIDADWIRRYFESPKEARRHFADIGLTLLQYLGLWLSKITLMVTSGGGIQMQPNVRILEWRGVLVPHGFSVNCLLDCREQGQRRPFYKICFADEVSHQPGTDRVLPITLHGGERLKPNPARAKKLFAIPEPPRPQPQSETLFPLADINGFRDPEMGGRQ